MKVKTQTPIDKGMIRVFVYGTLKQGQGNHSLLTHAESIFLGYDTITGPFRMYDLGAIPAIIDRPSFEPIKLHGEVYATTPEGLASLDMLEGHPNFYARRKMFSDRLNKRVWVYMLQADFKDNALDKDIIEAAIWRPSKAEKEFWHVT